MRQKLLHLNDVLYSSEIPPGVGSLLGALIVSPTVGPIASFKVNNKFIS
jgi:hypothetical protein